MSDSHVESLTTDPVSGGPVIQRRSMELFLEHLLGANEATEDLQKKETDKVATKSTNDSANEDSFENEEIEIVGGEQQ